MSGHKIQTRENLLIICLQGETESRLSYYKRDAMRGADARIDSRSEDGCSNGTN